MYRTELQTLQTCLFGDGDGEIFIPANGNQKEAEQTAQTTIGGLLLLNPSAECSKVAPSFLCISMFGLCNNRTRELYLPSSQECRTVTENICAEEFVAAGGFVDSNQLPQCDEFPDASLVQECTGILSYNCRANILRPCSTCRCGKDSSFKIVAGLCFQ